MAYWIGKYKASERVVSILHTSPELLAGFDNVIGLENGTWRVIGSLWLGVAGSPKRT